MVRRKGWRNCVTHHVSKQRQDCAMSKLIRVVETPDTSRSLLTCLHFSLLSVTIIEEHVCVYPAS
jgi:putative lipase involved disintegration of autophagic bodies